MLAATYLPPAVGLSMVAYWAMQGHPLSQQLVPWQQNILAKAALGLSAALSLVTALQPRLLFVTSDKEDPSSSSTSSSRTPGLGVKGYYQMLQTDWRRHFYNATAAYRRSKKTVYGLGTALSAPLILGQENS